MKVELKNVVKEFSGVKALNGVNLLLEGGHCVALVGENGAGKSTLMKILSGVYPSGSFSGEILVDGKTHPFYSPLDAEQVGISIIHQELSAFAHLTVAENLFVGHWPSKTILPFRWINWKKLQKEAQYWLNFVGAQCSPSDRMGDLSVGTQQMVEIAKVLSRQSRVIIFDEPTSALTPKEVERLFELIDRLKTENKAIVYISHKMEEIYRLADSIVVLRDGKSVHQAPTRELPQNDLIAHMVGRPLTQIFPPFPERQAGGLLLEVSNLEVTDSKRRGKGTLVGPLSFNLHQGEIIGVSGLLGSGRSELLQALYGDEQFVTKGVIRFHGAPISVGSPRQALRSQFAFVAEDRKRQSIFPKRSLTENVMISQLSVKSQLRPLSPGEVRAQAEKSIKDMRVRCFGPEQEIQTLSGGNQQKVVLGRALQVVPQIVLLDEPTRGIDVGAKYEIYELLFKLAQDKKGLLVVSSDLPELIGLCDRILVLSGGKLKGIVERKDFSQTRIMSLAVQKA